MVYSKKTGHAHKKSTNADSQRRKKARKLIIFFYLFSTYITCAGITAYGSIDIHFYTQRVVKVIITVHAMQYAWACTFKHIFSCQLASLDFLILSLGAHPVFLVYILDTYYRSVRAMRQNLIECFYFSNQIVCTMQTVVHFQNRLTHQCSLEFTVTHS